MQCTRCRSFDVVHVGKGAYVCQDCGQVVEEYRARRKPTPYERTRAQVYATGNRWAIENFHATHD